MLPQALPPFTGSVNQSNRDIFELALQTHIESNGWPEVVLESLNGCYPAGVSGSSWDGRGTNMLVKQSLSCPLGLKQTDLRFKIAAGRWITWRKMSFNSEASGGGEYGATTLSVTESGQNVVVVCNYSQQTNNQTRFVAIGPRGEIQPVKNGFQGANNTLNETLVFNKADIEGAALHLQYRPYRTVEFHNVSLKPGLKTRVTVSDYAEMSQAAPGVSAPPMPANIVASVVSNSASKPNEETNRIQLEYAEKQLEIAQRRYNAGVGTHDEYFSAEIARDIAKATDNPTEIARLKLKLADYNMKAAKARWESGVQPQAEYNKAKLERDLAAAAPLLTAEKTTPALTNLHVGLYLVTGPTNRGPIVDIPLADLTLDSTPLLDDHDIVSYEWKSHTIHIKIQDVADRILKRKGSDEPFVVVAGGERLYLGVLHSVGGSYGIIPLTPSIHVGFPADQTLPRSAVRIKRPSIEGIPDVRPNPRLKQELKALQLLDDSTTSPAPNMR